MLSAAETFDDARTTGVVAKSSESDAIDAVELVLRLANTHDHGGRMVEQLVDTVGLREWLAGEPSTTEADCATLVTPADVVEVREIRTALVALLLSHADASGCSEDDLLAAERALQRAAQRYPLLVAITRDGARLISSQTGLAGVIGSVLAAVAQLSQSEMWSRMKACRNCHHAFTDQSRNRSAGFCSGRCGSQAGMRAYRSRQRESAGD